MKLLGRHKIGEVLRAHRPLFSFPTDLRDAEIVVVEMEPQMRTIRWAERGALGRRYPPPKIYTHCWQLPYLQFFYTCGYLGVAADCRSKAIDYELGYDYFYRSPLPNVFDSGFVCQKRAENLNDAISIFFGSCFEPPGNWVLVSQFLTLAGWECNDRKKQLMLLISEALGNWWEQKSKNDPDFVRAVDFSEMGKVYWPDCPRQGGSLVPFLREVGRQWDVCEE